MTDRERIAVHEAGHAVAASMLGVGIRSVALTADGGLTTLDPLDRLDAGAARRALLILACGTAAEHALARRP